MGALETKRAALASIIREAVELLKLARQADEPRLVVLIAQAIDEARSLQGQLEADELRGPTDRRHWQ